MSFKVTSVSRSQFAESFFYLNGAPFSLQDYAFMRIIYDINPNRRITLKTSRQVSKSTTLANILLTNNCLLPRDPSDPSTDPGGFRSLYVSPSVDQTKIFSYDRFDPALKESPFIKKHYFNRGLRNNVFNKTLANRSTIYLRYALLSPDRLRGGTYDSIMFDEAQDMLPDVMEIIRQSLFTSRYKWEWLSGTPKRKKGTLAHYWFTSTMNEWMVKCEGCNTHNTLGEANIGRKGLICSKCGKGINPQHGTWVATNPDARKAENINEGFHISQLQFANAPWLNWGQDIVFKMENEGRATFYNEVLGMEYDDGVTPLTKEQIRSCCSDTPNGTYNSVARPAYMGIDWGPANSSTSYTCVTIITVNEHKIPIVQLFKRFVGEQAQFEFLHDEIPKVAKHWNVMYIGADRGMGEASNAELRKRFGKDKVFEFQHSTTLKQKVPLWNAKGRFWILNRNYEMGEIFTRIRTQKIIFPSFPSIEDPHVGDFLAIAQEFNEKTNKMYYVNSDPDDSMHSTIFATLVARIGGAFDSVYIY